MNPYATAAVWMGLAFIAAVIAARTGVAVALIEILVGIVVGNAFQLHSTAWVDFLAGFGSGLLTFLAGAEIEPRTIAKHWRETISIGFISFLFPFLGAIFFAHWVAGWDWRGAEIAGIALSTTSVAVVYAVMVETGFNETNLGRVILAACFITDLGTVLTLGLLFAHFNRYLLYFVVAMIVVLPIAPRLVRFVIRTTGGRVSEAPLSAAFRFPRREGMYTTLLMSTGLTFGTISALFGLTHGVIDQSRYTVLVTVVILSAFVPTLIAQQFFKPDREAHLARDRAATGATMAMAQD